MEMENKGGEDRRVERIGASSASVRMSSSA
jgi:hypothetical protein